MGTPTRLNITRYFRKPQKNGRAGLFSIYIDHEHPDTIVTQSGTADPVQEITTWYMQQTYLAAAKNVGRSNYKSPEDVAREDYDRMILGKVREGYTEFVDLDELFTQDRPKPQSLDTSLGHLLILEDTYPGFRPWKPRNTFDRKSKLWETAMSGNALFVRKMDGHGCILVKEDDLFDVYSLRTQRTSPAGGTLFDRLPLLEYWAQSVGWLIPNRSMLLAEIIPMNEVPDSYQYVTSIVKSSISEAVRKQDEQSYLVLYVWDILLWAGIPVGKLMPYADRLGTIRDIVQSVEGHCITDKLQELLHTTAGLSYATLHQPLPDTPMALIEPELVSIPSNITNPISYVLDKVCQDGWEGCVVTDPNELFGDRAWSTTGRAERPACSAKLKPIFEDDFLAIWNPLEGVGEFGTGKNKHRIGAIALYQWHDGRLKPCGQCGTGMTDELRESLMADFAQGPLTVQVSFQGWTPNGSLRFPSFIRVRDDKTPDECYYTGSLVLSESAGSERAD